MAGEAVARARALVGTKFRLHGRDAAHGVDCLGLVALVYELEAVPTGYALRSDAARLVAAAAGAFGFERRRGAKVGGDVVLLTTGPAQHHFGVWTGDGTIHADAVLGRVVETPGEPRWPVAAVWARREG